MVAAILAGGGRKVAIDFTALDYISSAGLRVLLGTAKKLSANPTERRFLKRQRNTAAHPTCSLPGDEVAGPEIGQGSAAPETTQLTTVGHHR